MHAYSEFYLSDSKRHLGNMFDYSINSCGVSPEDLGRLWSLSSASRQFGEGNPRFIAGMSGVELSFLVLEGFLEGAFPEPRFTMEYSPEYWAGCSLAHYQWHSSLSFSVILEEVSLSEVLCMYPLYHEMDITRFIEHMDNLMEERKGETRLKKLRESAGLSQAQLSRKAEVNLRNIQMYEQRQNSIDKAQGSILMKLSKALGCKVEDLLEDPFASL